ncbi:MAG: hypothetical protein IT336_11910 [Thermomicrobiales bacterium]|nr:hypothetical protein [Thermomicrobiales bacterium]
MNIVLLLLLFLALFGIGGWSEADPGTATGAAQQCVVAANGVERCGPLLADGRYQLPVEGPVIQVRVNNGPVAPDSQEGYEIVVGADGVATITERPMGSSGDLSDDERTVEQAARSVQIGNEGVQEILAELDACNLYYMTQRDEVDPAELPDGGGISIIEVSLADGHWEVFNQALTDGKEQDQFDGCQAMLAERFDIQLAR